MSYMHNYSFDHLVYALYLPDSLAISEHLMIFLCFHHLFCCGLCVNIYTFVYQTDNFNSPEDGYSFINAHVTKMVELKFLTDLHLQNLILAITNDLKLKHGHDAYTLTILQT